jgi:inosine-uridine nucleoside N-ribohydrolase
MSDHTVALTVVLDKDYRVDDAESIMSAIKMIKGVTSVEANVADFDTHVAYTRARNELEKKLFDALRDDNI